MPRGGARPNTGAKRKGAGESATTSVRADAWVLAWVDSKIGTLGRSRSEVIARLLADAALADGARPPLSPEERAQLAREKERIERMLGG